MKRKYLFSIAFLLTFFFVKGKSQNFYFDISKDYSTVEVGYYTTEKHKRVRLLKQSVETLNIDSIVDVVCPKSTEKTLVYIHGLGGDAKRTQKQIPKYFNDSLRGNRYTNRTISFVWHATRFWYSDTWQEGYETGKLFAPIFNKILENSSENATVLCHSMGHRIFEGVASELEKVHNKNLPIEDVIFTAPDLYTDAFNKNLAHLPDYCSSITIYIKKKDKTLGVSKMIHHANRMGLKGVTEFNEALKVKIQQIECSNTKSNAWWEISGHLYFLFDKKVHQDIKNLLVNEKRNFKLLDTSLNLYTL